MTCIASHLNSVTVSISPDITTSNGKLTVTVACTLLLTVLPGSRVIGEELLVIADAASGGGKSRHLLVVLAVGNGCSLDGNCCYRLGTGIGNGGRSCDWVESILEPS